MSPFDRRFQLVDDRNLLGLSCTANGIHLAGVPLLRKTAKGFAPRPTGEIAALMKGAYDQDVDAERLAPGLDVIADALDCGDLARAMIATLRLRLPGLTLRGAASIVLIDHALAKFNPDEPRDWRGRWTSGDGAAASTAIKPGGVGAGRPAGPHSGHSEPSRTHGAGHISDSSDIAIASSPAAAPPAIRFSPALQKIFDALWSRSFPGGRSHEQGADIVSSEDGSLGVQNVGGRGSSSGTFSPSLTMTDPIDYGVVGVFHTHPYDESEGGYTAVSLSGGDAAYIIDSNINFIIAQSGDAQFLFLKTRSTPSWVDFDGLNDRENARIVQLSASGISFPTASRIAAKETARRYGLAYYEGANGTFNRVYP